MKNYTSKLHGFEYVRISKQKARTLYNAGFEVVLNPVNLRLDNAWHTFFETQKEPDNNGDFDAMCNEFEYYNCNNKESGKFPAFYIPVFNCLNFQFKDSSNPYFMIGKKHNEIVNEVLKWSKNWNILQLKNKEKNIFFAVLESKRVRGGETWDLVKSF